MFNNICWLLKRVVLKRFVTKDFLTNNELPRIMQLYVATKIIFFRKFDFILKLINLNKILRGKSNTAHMLLKIILSFKQQLQIFAEVISNGNLDHFKFLKEYIESTGCNIDRNISNRPFSS